MQEKRRSVRVKTNAVMSFKVRSSGLTGDSRIIDISEGGVCFSSKQHIPVNSMLEIEIRSDDLKEPLKILARVVRITSREKGRSQFEVSLEFTELPFAKWVVLHDHIQRSI